MKNFFIGLFCGAVFAGLAAVIFFFALIRLSTTERKPNSTRTSFSNVASRSGRHIRTQYFTLLPASTFRPNGWKHPSSA